MKKCSLNFSILTNDLLNWIIPKGFQMLANSWRKRRELFKRVPFLKSLLSKNYLLMNKHIGKRCFILATGPSLTKIDIRLLKDEYCIGVSNFYLHPQYAIIKPKYYCIAPFHFPLTENFWFEWMKEIDKRTDDMTNYFFSVNDFFRCTQKNLFVNRELFFLDFSGSSINNSNKKIIDLQKPLLSPQSVPIMALMVAIYMGFSKIYLIGVDHDHLLHYGKSMHFYNESETVASNLSVDEWSNLNLEKEFKNHVILWEQYRKIKEIAEKQGNQIFNATEGGLLDVFTRVKLSDVLLEEK